MSFRFWPLVLVLALLVAGCAPAATAPAGAPAPTAAAAPAAVGAASPQAAPTSAPTAELPAVTSSPALSPIATGTAAPAVSPLATGTAVPSAALETATSAPAASPAASGTAAAPSAQGTPGTQVVVAMKNYSFVPDKLTVPVGTTVVWRNDDNTTHTVTADDGSFNSGDMGPKAEFKHTFTAAGTYPYYCIWHGGPRGQNMAGVVTVQ